MSIIINHLTKTYGQHKAVDDISFSIESGEIVGFLGPNGAGKSTTMKIASGYLSATSGDVKINGINIEQDRKLAQAGIGYLPEHNPLYLDMYVHEFLTFAGRVSHPQNKINNESIIKVIQDCGLSPEQNKQIGQLSKGYRQRVGLAQALLHDPKVLILDEPTTGLDPNQILEIRRLIKSIAKHKTVIFSTHIMQEVQALCDRVLLINKGKILADQSIDEFGKNLNGDVKLRVEFKEEIDKSLFQNLSQVDSIDAQGCGHYLLKVKDADKARSEVFAVASEKGLPLLGLQEESQGSLEEVFHSLTQSAS